MVILGAGSSLLGAIVNSWLTLRRERHQQLWSRELERFFQLEELAGVVAERLSGYRPIEPEYNQIGEKLSHLQAAAGRFRRYPEVTQAIRDFCNRAGWLLSRMGDFPSLEEAESAKADMVDAHKALLRACDEVLKRPSQ